MRHISIVLLVCAAACGSKSPEQTAAAAPAPAPAPAASAQPTVDTNALRLASTGKKPYDDKQILKTDVVSAWKAADAGGKSHEELLAKVTVYDPSNRKCWAWNKVTYWRVPPSTDVVQHAVSYKDADIAEVQCSSVGFTPPAAPKIARHEGGGEGGGGSQCSSGQTMCPTGCADLQMDRTNCGSCGHLCEGEKFACNHGECW